MNAHILIGLVVVSVTATITEAADWPQWRGPQRDGISQEKGLLKEWPKEGPKLLWKVNDAGSGYATPAIAGKWIFLMGNRGLDNEFVAARSVSNGEPVWETKVGKVGNPDQEPKFPAARSTPTVDGNRVYALGSDGDLVCLDRDSGALQWRKSLRADFGGRPGIWAYSESPLVDGDLVICTPGGKDAVMVALNKKSGEVVWKTALTNDEAAAYSSALVTDAEGTKQYVQMLEKGLIGVDAKTGNPLWRYQKTVSRYKANIPTPVVHAGKIYSAGAGTGGGTIELKKADGNLVPGELYFSPKLPSAIGGAVLVGDHLYGTGGAGMTCAEFATGTIKWEERALGAAAMCYADGRLYLNAENGEVGLVDPSPERYIEKGRFTPPDRPKRSQQMEKPWAYPVVADGRLYLRDHDLLWCYDVRVR